MKITREEARDLGNKLAPLAVLTACGVLLEEISDKTELQLAAHEAVQAALDEIGSQYSGFFEVIE